MGCTWLSKPGRTLGPPAPSLNRQLTHGRRGAKTNIQLALAAILACSFMIFYPFSHTAMAEFHVYVPEEFGTTYTYIINGSIKPFPEHGEEEYWFVETFNDTYLWVGPSFPGIHGYKELRKYRGEYVTFESSYLTLDDENWYAEHIGNIKINPNQDRGYYPKGIHGTHHDLEPAWWVWWGK